MSEYLTFTDEDDSKLFRVRVLNTGEVRIARYHRFTLAGRPLKFPCFADPRSPGGLPALAALRLGRAGHQPGSW